ncbi:MAG: ATP-binding cassette domain-containing protein [Melioribacteraceae bacterium]|nr:ATP-binding cassette domain-containing protein [Melioribacteraceae bacterium]MCF8264265.1 ATP-binding cassette domain-containing protein [Melioribacteraceae bacterium]MCF8413397.1 ATP-binding cassette domain-containing protein [Melioribacteraceae bacterium]MCF8431765.1 ATP-binding cassette domain-containing protein [Melioribacteraceae bacterium]
MSAQIQISQISFREDDENFYSDISLNITGGELVLVMGTYSSGGELLIKSIAGIIEPNSGEILINGDNIFDAKSNEIVKMRKLTSYVFDNGGLISNLSIEQNLLLPLNIHFPNLTDKEKEVRLNGYLIQFGLNDYRNKRPSELNIELRKLIGYVRALITNPKIIMMNEPLANLSAGTSEKFIDTIINLHGKGITQIINTYSTSSLLKMADRVVVMEHGHMNFIGNREDFYETHFADNTETGN